MRVPADYLIDVPAGAGGIPPDLIMRAFAATWRVDLDTPGFAVLDFGPVASRALRAAMLGLKDGLDAELARRGGGRFAYRSLGRFDQQATTRLHRDGAPDRSLLMLGYEASAVRSRLVMADLARCARDQALTPRQLLDDFNPMYRKGEELLAPYVTELAPPADGHARIVLVNNSALPFEPGADHPLGVLHGAEIPAPDPSRPRVINSIMLMVGEPDAVGPATLREFVAIDAISGPLG